MTELQELFVRGMKDFFPATEIEILQAVARHINENKVFVHNEGGKDVGFCILYMPKGPMDTAQVIHFYSEGSKIATHALVGRVLDFVKEKGYNKLTAINGSEASDEVWTRAFRHEGWEIKPVKTVFQFEVVK